MFYDPDMYRKAYVRYLRRGTPIELSLKAAAHPTPYYIWRTRGNDHVRSSHAANNGRIFAWDNPPSTGNPGEDFGCRCRPEPYYGTIPTQVAQAIREYLLDYLNQTSPWKNFEMSLYYFLGNGAGVTLDQMGHKAIIQTYYTQHYFPRFLAQTRQKAAHAPLGDFVDSFDQSYDFQDVFYSYRDSGIKGMFNGEIIKKSDGSRVVSARQYLYSTINLKTLFHLRKL